MADDPTIVRDPKTGQIVDNLPQKGLPKLLDDLEKELDKGRPIDRPDKTFEELDEQVTDQQSAWRRNLLEDEVFALKAYRGSFIDDWDGMELNSDLRRADGIVDNMRDHDQLYKDEKPLPPGLRKKLVKNIDAALSRTVITDRTPPLYRAIKAPFGGLKREGSLVGAEFDDQGYTSWSIDEPSTEMFGEWATMEMKPKKGMKGAYVEAVDRYYGTGIGEMLLPRGGKYRVTHEYEDDAGMKHLVVEVI